MTGHSPESHRIQRTLQAENDDNYHHPVEKIQQLERFKDLIKGEILEVFAGQGNLTEFYKNYGHVTAMTKEGFGSSFDAIFRLRGENKRYKVIDIDSYGYPDLFFPVVFELMNKEAILIFTFPIVGINCLNGITEQHFITFWGSTRPTIGIITGVLTDMALRNWTIISFVDVVKIKRIWRFIYKCKRIKATDMCYVRNQ